MYYSYQFVLPQIYFKNLDEMVNSDFKKWVIEKSDKMEDGIKKFLELSTTKRPKNDKAAKNPDTPKS